MTMRILSGRKFNLLERGIVSTATAHAQLGQTRMYDGRPSRAYRAGSLAVAQLISVDGNLLTDGTTNYGGFEAWSGGSPVGWTETSSGSGDVTQEGTIVNSGASAAKLTTGTGPASCYRDVVVKAGEIINISSALRGDGTTGTADLAVYNPLTHNYLDSGGNWTATPSIYRTQLAASWSVVTAAVTVESYAACQSDLVTLRVTVENTRSSTLAYVDDVYIWPRVNFGSVHGHNLDAGSGAWFLSSANEWGTNAIEATPTKTRPSFYALFAATNQDRRWWGFQVPLANSVPFEIGELVIGYAQTPSRQYDAPLESTSRWDRQASITPGGERHVHKRSKWQVRGKVFHYRFYSQAAYDNAVELFHLRPEGDTYPVVIVPDTTLPEVIHGRLETTFADARHYSAVYHDATVVLTESPFASTAF